MRIFISPLDWGLGHAARCVPVIRYLLEKGIEVIIGTEGMHLLFLKEHFPQVEFAAFPGYRISYSSYFHAGVKTLLQLPDIRSAINKEHTLLSKLINERNINAVISDNRYGLWSKKIPSVIITHQLNIQTPLASSFLSKSVQRHIKHFYECWIPDYAGAENLSGALSHPIPNGINGKYIGPLTRFHSPTQSFKKKEYDLLVVLSGPEPQRSILEKKIIKQLNYLPLLKTLIIQGLPGNKPVQSNLKNVEILPHLPDTELQDKILVSEIILSRPGYSTIMDLHKINRRKWIFIPTPGQTEQEYLARLMQKKEMAVTCSQKDFLLEDILKKAEQFNPGRIKCRTETYKEVIDAWLDKNSLNRVII